MNLDTLEKLYPEHAAVWKQIRRDIERMTIAQEAGLLSNGPPTKVIDLSERANDDADAEARADRMQSLRVAHVAKYRKPKQTDLFKASRLPPGVSRKTRKGEGLTEEQLDWMEAQLTRRPRTLRWLVKRLQRGNATITAALDRLIGRGHTLTQVSHRQGWRIAPAVRAKPGPKGSPSTGSRASQERKDRVEALLKTGPAKMKELVDTTGFHPSIIYEALAQFRTDGRLHTDRVVNGNGGAKLAVYSLNGVTA